MNVTEIPFRKRVALNLFSKYRKNESKIHRLNYIFWECTLRCNLNCKHCGSDCMKDTHVPDMPASDFFKALNEVSGIVEPSKTMIVFTGGEPLVRRDLEQIGLKIAEKGFPWGIVTNGMLLTKQRLFNLIHTGLSAITISLDGLQESHNWLRGNNNSFKNAFKAIALLATVPNIEFDVITCVNQRNFTELNQIKEMLIKLEVKHWRVFTIFPIGRAKDQDELQLPSEKFKLLFDFIEKTRLEGRIKLNYGCEGFLGDYEKKVRDNFFICHAGINVASILVDGSISACPNLRENFIQGNIYKDNFREVWENKYSIFRDKSWTKTGICANCNFYDYCEGNGMHLRDEKDGSLLFCHLKRIEEGEKKLSTVIMD